MNTWGRIKCWFRGQHNWNLKWSPHDYRGRTQWILEGSECLGCGKYRKA